MHLKLPLHFPWTNQLTHGGEMTHICVSRLTITGSDNGLLPGRHQAIISTNAGIVLIGPLKTNLNENAIEILTFSFPKMQLKVSSAKWRPFCLGLNVLSDILALNSQQATFLNDGGPSHVIYVCMSLSFLSQFISPVDVCARPLHL